MRQLHHHHHLSFGFAQDRLYDSLYRLKEANYSDGRYFHYTYDAVGNRLNETKCPAWPCPSPTVTNYSYDSANRLTSVNGQTYQWDANGNLLEDGTTSYTYDAANRLKTVVSSQSSSAYTYSGLGDRLSQTVDSVTTNYVLDLNAGLTQVLADGTNTYLYGNGRIGELQPGGFAYHLGDALGSVRQLTDASGTVTLTRSFEPYGNTLSSAGNGSSVWQFTGEARDASGLTFLRARYFASNLGRFITKDAFSGSYIKLPTPTGGSGLDTSQASTDEWPNYTRPQTLNGWNYTEGNPINLTDPSGRYSCKFTTAKDQLNYEDHDWLTCKEFPDAVLRLLSSDPSNKPVSYALWQAVKKYDATLQISYYSGGNIHGGWLGGTPIVEIYSAGVPNAAPFRSGALSTDDLGYVSVIAHEFVHIALQAGYQNTPWGEADAFAIQSFVLEEIGGTEEQVNYLRKDMMIGRYMKVGAVEWGISQIQACASLSVPWNWDKTLNRAIVEFALIKEIANGWQQ